MRVAAVILAAGKASRMGGPNKVLALFGGKPLVAKLTEQAEISRCDEVFVVTSRDADKLGQILGSTSAIIIHNPDFESGMGTSIALGAKRVAIGEPQYDAFILLFADMPLVTWEHIDKLVEAFKADPDKIIRGANGKAAGHPILFPKRHFAALTKLDGDSGAKNLVHQAELIDIGQAAIIDVDTPEALVAAGGSLDFL